jgi:uncharacterized membrane protein
MQSTITFLALFVVWIVAGVLPLVGGLLGFAVSVLSLVVWILLMVRALQGEWYKLPIVGDMAEDRTRLPA